MGSTHYHLDIQPLIVCSSEHDISQRGDQNVLY